LGILITGLGGYAAIEVLLWRRKSKIEKDVPSEIKK